MSNFDFIRNEVGFKTLLKQSIAGTQTLLDSRMQEYFG